MSESNVQQYLIVGGDSMIGRYLFNRLKKRGEQVFYTTRKKIENKESAIYLDLEINIETWRPPKGITTAFFCAAVTSIAFCERNINESRKINVVNTVKIIDILTQRGISVIFLSSNQVFSGDSLYPDETSLTMPHTEYGRQKLEVEEILKSIPAINHTIIRATKIIYPEFQLFNDWILSLNKKIPIYPFADLIFSPVAIDYFVTLLLKITKLKEGGVWHISGDKDLSYYDAALLIAKKIGADQKLVQYSRAKDKLKGVYLMQSTVLKCNKIRSRLKIKPPKVEETIKQIA